MPVSNLKRNQRQNRTLIIRKGPEVEGLQGRVQAGAVDVGRRRRAGTRHNPGTPAGRATRAAVRHARGGRGLARQPVPDNRVSRLCWPLAIWEQKAIRHAPALFERHTGNVRIRHLMRSGSRSRTTGPTIQLGLTHSLFSPQGQAWERVCRSAVTSC